MEALCVHARRPLYELPYQGTELRRRDKNTPIRYNGFHSLSPLHANGYALLIRESYIQQNTFHCAILCYLKCSHFSRMTATGIQTIVMTEDAKVK
jgi:hypothetical protein